MRNPGWNQEQVWTASCDVTFNGVDFGPNLQYGKLTVVPAEIRLISYPSVTRRRIKEQVLCRMISVRE